MPDESRRDMDLKRAESMEPGDVATRTKTDEGEGLKRLLEELEEAYEIHLNERHEAGELAPGSHYTYKWGAKRFVSWVKNDGEHQDGRLKAG